MSKILVIDDEPNVVKLFKYNLEADGYDVITAVNGEDGLEQAKDQVPDLILLDYMLPGMDGIETCKQLKSDRTTRDIPVLMISCRSGTVDSVHAIEAGAVDYVCKPADPADIRAHVKEHLRK